MQLTVIVLQITTILLKLFLHHTAIKLVILLLKKGLKIDKVSEEI